MKFSTFFLSAAAATTLFVGTSCKKSESSPSYGSASVNGKSYDFKSSSAETKTSSFVLTGATTADSNATNIAGVEITFKKRPTADGNISVGDSASVSFTYADAETLTVEQRSYRKTGEKVSVKINGGKLTVSFNNLTQTSGATPNAALTGSIIEK